MKKILISSIAFLLMISGHAQSKDTTNRIFLERSVDEIGLIFYSPDKNNFCIKHRDDGHWGMDFKDTLSALNAVYSSDSALLVTNIGLHLRIDALASFALSLFQFNQLPKDTKPIDVLKLRQKIKEQFAIYLKLKEMYP